MFQGWVNRIHSMIGQEVSSFSRYFDRLFQFDPLPHDAGGLLEAIDCPQKVRLAPGEPIPDQMENPDDRTLVLLNGNINHNFDIQGLLSGLKPRLNRFSRVVLIAYNPYLRWAFWLADRLGLRKGAPPMTFVTREVVGHLAQLSGYELVRIRPVAYVPKGVLGGFSERLNRLLAAIPVVRWLGLVNIIVLRPIIPEKGWPSISILIPARNEAGNIEAALQRMPKLGDAEIEVIYVEGHSQDDTWKEIQRVIPLYSHRFKIKAFQQKGVGKNDAVKMGMANATGDLVTILDADLTMPPEFLGRFYNAWRQGLGDFVNGNRLVYPMEDDAMRFLNWLANMFFAKALSSILDVPLGDCLCGTKLVAQRDYKRMRDWCEAFGDFDPFGDFEFIFPAAELSMGTVEIPIQYKARLYGETQISRFRHGLMLLRMTAVGFFRICMGKGG